MEKYSVLMSVYFKEKPEYLKTSMKSIFAQSLPTDDFVLFCDGSLTPELDQVIEEFEKQFPTVLHVIRKSKNGGLGPALAEGIQQCKNDLVARMDSDDIAPENRCEIQVEAFAENPKLGILGGAIDEFENDLNHIVSKKVMPQSYEKILSYAKMRSPFNHPSVMYRKSAVLAAGNYPNIPLHEDYGLWVAMLQNGVYAENLSQVLCHMRVDAGMYNRRGGWKYYKTVCSFRKYMYQIGFCSFTQFISGVCLHSVACLVPASIRKSIYRILLRKKA